VCSAHPARAGSCAEPECFQFDFIVGNWVVKDLSKHAIATDTISKTDANCTLIEEWRGVGGNEGLAVITYQSAQKTWHRDALLRSSVILAFEGRMTGGSMVMTAKQYSESGISRLHRISWTPRNDGTIEEVWQTSMDTGKSWQTRFDEILTRIAE
jgi:hypothetical protein